MEKQDIGIDTLTKLEQIHGLTAFGFTYPLKDLFMGRQVVEVRECFDIVQYWQKRQQINKKVSSYRLKHIVESYLDVKHGHRFYVAMGSLQAALILAGFQYRKLAKHSPTCYFNVCQRDITMLQEKEQELIDEMFHRPLNKL